MKKVLMIAYYYPPLGGVGMLRTLKFAKYLPKFGWQPVILTPENGVCSVTCDKSEGDLEGVEIVRTGYFDIFGVLRKFQSDRQSVARENFGALKSKGLKNRLSVFLQKSLNEWLAFPDSRIGWYPYGVRKGLERVNRGDISIIFSTSAPETAHLIAYSLKKKTGIPWVADLRDLWTQCDAYRRTILRVNLERRLEKAVLSKADVLTTVSFPLVQQLKRIDSRIERVFSLTNGFDPDDFPKDVRKQNQKFTISYTGTVYIPYRDPELLFRVVQLLIDQSALNPMKVEINFYGHQNPYLTSLIEKYSLKSVVQYKGFITRRQALQVQQNSSILLFLDWNNPAQQGVFTGKIFEYLGARRPILCISNHETVVTELLKKTNAGVVVRNEEEMKSVLLKWYREFIQRGEVKYHGIESEIMKYTRENKTRELVEIFERVLER